MTFLIGPMQTKLNNMFADVTSHWLRVKRALACDANGNEIKTDSEQGNHFNQIK